MNRLSKCASPLRLYAVSFSVLIAGLVLVSAASAVTLDFNVANGNFTTPGNWVDSTGVTGMNPIPVPTSATPTVADNAFIRNNGTATINSDVQALQIRIGHENVITNPDYDNNGVVDANDYVLWRKGGALQNDATPADVTPDDYNYWRLRFGGTPLTQEIGKSGTLIWTAGKITGQGNIGTDAYSGGPDIRVGRVRTTNGNVDEITGTVIQNGPTTELLLPYRQSQLAIGDGTAGTHTPTSSYTLMSGTIGTAIGSTVYQNDGPSSNDGIRVRNGTFTMTGGHIVDATPLDYKSFPLVAQRFLTVGTAPGLGAGNEAVATANLSGGDINSLGGIRVATANNSRGYLNINGPITIVTGGDTIIGEQPKTSGTNALGVMTMSNGSLQIGRTDIANQTGNGLKGRLIIGDTGPGTLTMTGGSIMVTRDIRVGARNTSGGSSISMTAGSITTPGLDMGNTNTDEAHNPSLYGVGGSIIVDGTASFTQTPTAFPDPNGVQVTVNGNTTIGNQGKSLFEVRGGNALLGGGGTSIELAKNSTSEATINLKGGKLTLGGPVNRTNTSSAAPVIGLTGGILEFNNTTLATPHQFRADLSNAGSELILKQNAVQQVQVGSVSPGPFPANFAMTSGSWDLEIGSHAVTGADSFNVPLGTASLTGGTLNISYISGYTPTAGDVFNIITSSSAPTLGTVAIAGSGSPNWSLQTAGNIIQLKWNGAGSGTGLGGSAVPEPSSVVLLVFAAAGLVSAKRIRYRTSVQQN